MTGAAFFRPGKRAMYAFAATLEPRNTWRIRPKRSVASVMAGFIQVRAAASRETICCSYRALKMALKTLAAKRQILKRIEDILADRKYIPPVGSKVEQ